LKAEDNPMQHHPEYERTPMTQPELNTYLLGWAMLFAVLGGLVYFAYEPGLLAWFLFTVFWVVQLVIHEAGHALMAKALGWHVGRVVIGMGRTVTRFRIGRTSVEVRFAPTEGFVQPVPNNVSAPQLKNALIYFAGPGVELVILLVIVWVVGIEALFTRSEEPLLIAAKTMAAALFLSCFVNLWPHDAEAQSGRLPNDGLGILLSFRMPDSYFGAQVGRTYDDEKDEWREHDSADGWKRNE
jgi:hypothetical protein